MGSEGFGSEEKFVREHLQRRVFHIKKGQNHVKLQVIHRVFHVIHDMERKTGVRQAFCPVNIRFVNNDKNACLALKLKLALDKRID